MRRLDFSDTAEEDLRSIGRYIADRSGRPMADTVQDKLIARCERLSELPGTLGTARPDLALGLRSTPHKGYIIYFRYLDDAVLIVNILDARRDALAYFDSGEDDD